VGAVVLVLERGGCEVQRSWQIAGPKGGQRGAEAVEREGEVVGTRVRVGGGCRVRGDGRAEEGCGFSWWRGG
jgi:hypothetical protein